MDTENSDTPNKNIFLEYSPNDIPVHTINMPTDTEGSAGADKDKKKKFRVHSIKDMVSDVPMRTGKDILNREGEPEFAGIKVTLPVGQTGRSNFYGRRDPGQQNTDPYLIITDIVNTMIEEDSRQQ